jgi:hypothetical protein
MSDADKAVYEIMQDIPLKSGEMLLLGPLSVKMLSTEGAFKGKLPDKFVFQAEEWKLGKWKTEAGQPVKGRGK